MDIVTPLSHSPILGLICSAFGHDYMVIPSITDQIKEYKCVCCGKQASMKKLLEKA